MGTPQTNPLHPHTWEQWQRRIRLGPQTVDSSHLRLGVEGHSDEWVPRGLGLQVLALHHRLSSHAKHLGHPWFRSLPSSLSFDHLSSPHLQHLIRHTWGHSQPWLSTLDNYVAIKHCIIILHRPSNQTKTLAQHSQQLYSH